MHIHQFTLTLALENIFVDELGLEVRDTQFLTHLSLQSNLWSLVIVDMTTNSRVPLAWLYVLPVWTALEIDFTLGIEHMKMYYRVKQLDSAMALAPCCSADNLPAFVYYGEYLLLIIHM